MDSQPCISIDKLIKAENYPIHLETQAWIHIPLKINFFFIENKRNV